MAATTPMMAQYLDIKAAHPDALLFYRMGDFYEMFFDDAVAAAEALDIALTKRGKHDGQDIPMCGVPVHAAEGYLLTLIRKGFRVAVGEQLESPAEAKKRGSKSVVKRDVVRLVTPGTLTEDTLLDARRHNFLAAFARVRDTFALAWADISTGAFHVLPLPPARLGAELARLAPAELLVSETDEPDLRETARDMGVPLTVLPRTDVDSGSGERRLSDLFGVASTDAFGGFDRAELAAMGGLVGYLDLTQKGRLPLLAPPRRDRVDRNVQIDAATRRNLELTHALSGGRAGSLLSVIDRTLTSGGARLLERRLSSPSREAEVIRDRLDTLDMLTGDASLREDLRAALRQTPDLDRALSRLALDRGGPRDLAAIRNALTQAAALADRTGGTGLLQDQIPDLTGFDDLLALLDDALVAEPPLLTRDGGFVAAGFHPDLDESRTLRDEGRSVIAALQKDYARDSGVASLKIKHNNVLGYFVETTATHAERMLSPPLSDTFIHRQTTANQVRFTTVKLSEMETRILNAGSRALEIEKRIFDDLRASVLSEAARLHAAARTLAEIDLAAGLADLAMAQGWTRPVIDTSRHFDVEGGRHPVVEQALQRDGAPFVANDCALTAKDGAAIRLLTGPNMAGKSTYLRQNALIALLAQMGSYVPASHARIGLVSQIFSRVGAADDLARGRSTFMVEMVETAAILNQADDRALVILDEIGRGTATYDGLSIAWAVLEHLHEVNGCRALFATHYHELTALAGQMDNVTNATVAVREWNGEVIFLHEVRDGAADRSYGVQVAQLAGLPASVVTRARTVLQALEQGDRAGAAKPGAVLDDLPLFAVAPPQSDPVSPVLDLLNGIRPDDLSPRQALDLIYQLKKAAGSTL